MQARPTCRRRAGVRVSVRAPPALAVPRAPSKPRGFCFLLRIISQGGPSCQLTGAGDCPKRKAKGNLAPDGALHGLRLHEKGVGSGLHRPAPAGDRPGFRPSGAILGKRGHDADRLPARGGRSGADPSTGCLSTGEGRGRRIPCDFFRKSTGHYRFHIDMGNPFLYNGVTLPQYLLYGIVLEVIS